MPTTPLSIERLSQLAAEALAIAEICDHHGEADGASAARAQHRALSKEVGLRSRGGGG